MLKRLINLGVSVLVRVADWLKSTFAGWLGAGHEGVLSSPTTR